MNRILILAIVLSCTLLGIAAARLQDTGMPQKVDLAVTPEPPKELPPDVAKRLLEEAQATRSAMEKSAQVWTVAGPETMGSVIQVGDRKIQLPADVYVESLIVEVECVEGDPCPETPYYILEYKDAPKDMLVVTVNSGVIIDNRRNSPEERQRLRTRFSWLEEALK